MPTSTSPTGANLPLEGCRVVERSRSVAAAYAGRLLCAMGAEVVLLEDEHGSPLRSAPPLLEGGGSALFAYLAAGKRSRVADLGTPAGQRLLQAELAQADILIDDTPVGERAAQGLEPGVLSARHPRLVQVSVLPFGASGPKAGWIGEEINLLHAGGEGFLLPNGLSQETFPDRPPLKIAGHFAGYQGGCAAALAALTGWWSVPRSGGQAIDVSVQDAVLGVSAFALQRLGDGSLEHRTTRRFRYGGVFEAEDGFVELLTLEDRQWEGLVALIGHPGWAADEALRDGLERSRRGDEINRHLREWMARHKVEDIVRRAQQLGVPAARYRDPAEVVAGRHERERGLFAPVAMTTDGHAPCEPIDVLVAPFQFRESPLQIRRGVPALNDMAEAAREPAPLLENTR